MELTWNNAMEPIDSLTENESLATLEDFLVMLSFKLQYTCSNKDCQCQGRIVHWRQGL